MPMERRGAVSVMLMESRMRGNLHVRFGPGENPTMELGLPIGIF